MKSMFFSSVALLGLTVFPWSSAWAQGSEHAETKVCGTSTSLEIFALENTSDGGMRVLGGVIMVADNGENLNVVAAEESLEKQLKSVPQNGSLCVTGFTIGSKREEKIFLISAIETN